MGATATSLPSTSTAPPDSGMFRALSTSLSFETATPYDASRCCEKLSSTCSSSSPLRPTLVTIGMPWSERRIRSV